MKKLFTMFALFLLIGVINETKAQFSVGPGATFATDISGLGLSANGVYQIDDTWAVSGAFTYFLEKDNVKWTAIDINANYNLTEVSGVGILYGIGGINITSVKIDLPSINLGEFGSVGGSASASNFGVNLGAGVNIELSEKMVLAPELTYTVSSGGYLRIGAKLLFSL